MINIFSRTQCPLCLAATLELVEEDYISNNKLSGPEDLTVEDRAQIKDRALRLLEEDRGITCEDHMYDELV